MTRLISLLIFLTIIVIAFLSLKPDSERSLETVKGLPWQIELLPEGRSNVMGITLGEATLADARAHLGEDMELAIVIAAGQREGGLEMFYRHHKAGVFPGKLVVAADVDAATLAPLLQRAVRSEYMDSGARKLTLNPSDLPQVMQTPVASLTFIPIVRIDEDSAVQRFGRAAEMVQGKGGVTHLLYPDKGLDLMISDTGRGILQYVAPRDFERLREPLL